MIRLLKNFINWLRPTFEDQQGQASARRITAFFFVLMSAYVLKQYMNGVRVEEFIWYGILGTILLLFGVITWQNVESFRNGK